MCQMSIAKAPGVTSWRGRPGATLNRGPLFRYTAPLLQQRACGMARIITCNTNGIRAAARKGFFDWLCSQDADVVCIQETKARIEQLETGKS